MRTADHVVDDLTKKGYGTDQKPLPIFVFGTNEKLLYSPSDLKITLKSVGAKSIEGLDETTVDKVQDVALLNLSKKIAAPIPAATNDLAPGSPVYIAGFMIPTSDRKSYGALDSDGISRIISRGHILENIAAHNRAKEKFGTYPKGLLDEFLRYLVVSTADGGPGLSGAPTLNQNGEYVGVYNSGTPQSGEAEPLRFSYSVPTKLLEAK